MPLDSRFNHTRTSYLLRSSNSVFHPSLDNRVMTMFAWSPLSKTVLNTIQMRNNPAKGKLLLARMSKFLPLCKPHQAFFSASGFIDLTSGRQTLTNTARLFCHRPAGVFIMLVYLWSLGLALVNTISITSCWNKLWMEGTWNRPGEHVRAFYCANLLLNRK